MNQKLHFGTDGWRAVIADEFTYDNLSRVAQATCEVVGENASKRLILVGYDGRFLSKPFALTAAHVALANGFKVELSDEPITSPTLSCATKQRKAAIGIMITASHNPYRFNGFKLKGPHGGSVDSTLTQAIESKLDPLPPEVKEARVKTVDFKPAYLKELKKRISKLSLSKIKGDIIFDSMHGPGAHVFEQVIGSNNKIVYMGKNYDPLFGGKNPEPIEQNLKTLREVVVRKKAAVGIAVDGDADRVGLVDNKGKYIPPHTVMPLLLKHLIENRKLKGKVVQTVSMGYLPGRIAAKYDLPFEEVSVGFKYIAARIQTEKVLFGGEESGGYGVGLWSSERDGVLCALLLLELLSMSKKPLSDLIDDLHREFGASHFKRVDFRMKQPVDKVKWTENIIKHVPAKIGAHPVKSTNPLDGVKIHLEDDSWVLMRPSGTEPVIRTYSEGSSHKVVKDLLAEAERLVHLAPPRSHRHSSKDSGKNKNKNKGQKKLIGR